MIEWWQALILALIQGITEFLPISSSAHLILPSEVLGWQDQGLAFDVAVHFGSLIAVLAYFRTQVVEIAVGGLRSVTGNWTPDGKLAWLLVLATIPAGLAGLAFDDYIEANMRTAAVIASTTLTGAILLALADRTDGHNKTLVDVTWQLALIIGIAQAVALIPGTSRSGITMTMALFLGLQRTSAAQFSFLMSIPVIVLSAGWKSLDLVEVGAIPWGQIVMAMFASGISAYLCIKYFLAFIEKIGFMPFVVYRLILVAALLLLIV